MGGRGSGGSKNGGGGAANKIENEVQKRSQESTASDLKSSLISKVDPNGQIRNSDFRTSDEDGEMKVSVRGLGRWQLPDYIDSDSNEAQDYDWEVLSSKSRSQIDSVVNKVQKNTGRKISWSAEEKNWINFYIK